jgi:ribosomal protein S27E
LDREWRCTQCGKLLGRTEGGRLRVRFSRKHEYMVALPATATCWGCGALNEFLLGGETKDESRTVQP